MGSLVLMHFLLLSLTCFTFDLITSATWLQATLPSSTTTSIEPIYDQAAILYLVAVISLSGMLLTTAVVVAFSAKVENI